MRVPVKEARTWLKYMCIQYALVEAALCCLGWRRSRSATEQPVLVLESLLQPCKDTCTLPVSLLLERVLKINNQTRAHCNYHAMGCK